MKFSVRNLCMRIIFVSILIIIHLISFNEFGLQCPHNFISIGNLHQVLLVSYTHIAVISVNEFKKLLILEVLVHQELLLLLLKLIKLVLSFLFLKSLFLLSLIKFLFLLLFFEWVIFLLDFIIQFFCIFWVIIRFGVLWKFDTWLLFCRFI